MKLSEIKFNTDSAEAPQNVAAQSNQEAPAAEKSVAETITSTESATDEGNKTYEKYVPEVTEVPSRQSAFKDEYIEGLVTTLIDKYEKGEDIRQILKSVSADYNSVADEEIIRMDIESSNPGLSKGAIDKLVNKKLASIYSVDDEDDEDEMSIRNQLIKQEADRIRQKKAEEQNALISANKLSPEEAKKREQEAIKQQVEQWTDMVYSDPDLSQVLKTGKMQVEEFAYQVNPEEMVKAMVVPGFFENLFKSSDEKMDLKKWARVVAYALNPDAYDRFLLSSGKTVGTGKLLDRLENPSKGNIKPQGTSESSLVEALKTAIKAKV